MKTGKLNPNCRYPISTRVLNDLMMDVNKGSKRYWIDDFFIHRMHHFHVIRELYKVMERTGIQFELHKVSTTDTFCYAPQLRYKYTTKSVQAHV